jgi:hypothetical protein
MIRKAKAIWRGTGRDGSGNLSTDSGVLASTPLAGTDGSRQPVEAELTTARNLGSRLARVAGCLRDLRAGRASTP